MGRHGAGTLATWAVLCAGTLALSACEATPEGETRAFFAPLVVSFAGPPEVLPGTLLAFEGEGLAPPELGIQTVTLRGSELNLGPYDLDNVDGGGLALRVDADLHSALRAAGETVPLELTITRRPWNGVDEAHASLDVELLPRDSLVPAVTDLAPRDASPGAEVAILGQGFLQHGEGSSVVWLDGELVQDDTGTARPLTNVAVPAEYRSRHELAITLTPDLFGIRPARFEGRVRVTNDVPGIAVSESAWLSDVDLRYGEATVTTVSPVRLRRGQTLRVEGRGFLAPDPAFGVATLALLEGRFVGRDGDVRELEDDRALALYPDVIDGNSALSVILRVSLSGRGELVGLAARPGAFEGIVSPLTLNGLDAHIGLGREVRLEILPQLQVVRLAYLASFDDALREFGLFAVRDAVRERILAVCRRDYEGVSIRFQEEIPEDFEEFAVVEILGTDPNGAGLLGLDNTAGKDVGNLRFNDFIGGLNAESGAAGFYPFGGVFVASFLQFSPTLAGSDGALTSPRFDDVFGPFVPALGGTPVAEGEYPGGTRDAGIEQAIRALGNLVGNTVGHEIGHSLGLAAVEGSFHNIGDEPNRIMDDGAYRPFLERAELDGFGPARLAPHNRSYLREILPTE